MSQELMIKPLIAINKKRKTKYYQIYINIINDEIKNIKIRRNNINVPLFNIPTDIKTIDMPHFIGHTDKTLYGLNEKNKKLSNDNNGLYHMFYYERNIDKPNNDNEIIIFKIIEKTNKTKEILPIIQAKLLTKGIINDPNKLYIQGNSISLYLYGFEFKVYQPKNKPLKYKAIVLPTQTYNHVLYKCVNVNLNMSISSKPTNTNISPYDMLGHYRYTITKLYYGLHKRDKEIENVENVENFNEIYDTWLNMVNPVSSSYTNSIAF